MFATRASGETSRKMATAPVSKSGEQQCLMGSTPILSAIATFRAEGEKLG